MQRPGPHGLRVVPFPRRAPLHVLHPLVFFDLFRGPGGHVAAHLHDARWPRPGPTWLGVPPQPSLHPGVWCVVSLAALNAMESTRCTITRLSIDASPGGVLPPAGRLPAIRRQAARAGISRFKMLLADFVAQRRPDAWRAGLPESHPFIAAVPHHPFIRVVAAG